MGLFHLAHLITQTVKPSIHLVILAIYASLTSFLCFLRHPKAPQKTTGGNGD
jgi:hypothetical protein